MVKYLIGRPLKSAPTHRPLTPPQARRNAVEKQKICCGWATEYRPHSSFEIFRQQDVEKFPPHFYFIKRSIIVNFCLLMENPNRRRLAKSFVMVSITILYVFVCKNSKNVSPFHHLFVVKSTLI